MCVHGERAACFRVRGFGSDAIGAFALVEVRRRDILMR